MPPVAWMTLRRVDWLIGCRLLSTKRRYSDPGLVWVYSTPPTAVKRPVNHTPTSLASANALKSPWSSVSWSVTMCTNRCRRD